MENTIPGINYNYVLQDLINDCDLQDPVIKIIDGKPAVEKVVPLTVERACLTCLNHKEQGESITSEQHGERYEVIKKVKAHKPLDSLEIAVILTLAVKALTAMCRGQLKEQLEAK